MGICTPTEHGKILWRMRECFHYTPYLQVETMRNLPCKHACITLFQAFMYACDARLLLADFYYSLDDGGIPSRA